MFISLFLYIAYGRFQMKPSGVQRLGKKPWRSSTRFKAGTHFKGVWNGAIALAPVAIIQQKTDALAFPEMKKRFRAYKGKRFVFALKTDGEIRFVFIDTSKPGASEIFSNEIDAWLRKLRTQGISSYQALQMMFVFPNFLADIIDEIKLEQKAIYELAFRASGETFDLTLPHGDMLIAILNQSPRARIVSSKRVGEQIEVRLQIA